jgi:hypothetical protein
MQLPSPIPHPLDLMPWEVPGWAHGLLEFAVGVDWPQGDEKAVWDLADRWLAAASTLVDPGEEAGVAAGEVLSGYGGAGLVANAFEQAWRQVGVGEDAPLPIVIALCHELGGLVEGCGADIEAAKLEVYVELSLLLIELAALAVMVFLTFGAASPAAGGARRGGRGGRDPDGDAGLPEQHRPAPRRGPGFRGLVGHGRRGWGRSGERGASRPTGEGPAQRDR